MVSMSCLLKVVCVVAAVSTCHARPQFGGGNSDASATILRDERTMNDGQYQFVFETSNGIFRQEEGSDNGGGSEQAGGWSYTSPEGIPVEITFTSNSGGFQPVGALLPVAPQLPYQRTQVY